MTPDARDLEWMNQALQAARKGQEAGEVPIGALAVRDGEILAAAHNRTISATDPTAHAEILALRAAAVRLENHRLSDVSLYVTLEPCVMCIGAMVQGRIQRLVFGAPDPKIGATALLESGDLRAGLNHRFEVTGGVLADESTALLRAFFAARR